MKFSVIVFEWEMIYSSSNNIYKIKKKRLFLLKYKLRSYIFNKIVYFLLNKQMFTIKLNFDSPGCTITQNKTTDEYYLISPCLLKLFKWKP